MTIFIILNHIMTSVVIKNKKGIKGAFESRDKDIFRCLGFNRVDIISIFIFVK